MTLPMPMAATTIPGLCLLWVKFDTTCAAGKSPREGLSRP